MDSVRTRVRRIYKRDSKENRREALINAVLKLTGEGGAQAATLRAIAQEAGVTAGLVRHYFQTKDELVRAAYQSLMQDLRAEPAAQEGAMDATARLARFVVASVTPPIADPAMVASWAGFLYLVRAEADMREVHLGAYQADYENLQQLIAEIHPMYSAEQLRSAAIACNAVIDGLWLEASLISDSFAPNEVVAVGLLAVGAILGIDLTAAKAP